jgi:hypothetical protein
MASETVKAEVTARWGDEFTCEVFRRAVEWSAKYLERQGYGDAADTLRVKQRIMDDLLDAVPPGKAL